MAEYKTAREKRKRRVRKRVTGSDERPRLNVFKSSKYTYAQLISDTSNKVICGVSTKKICEDGKSSKSRESAKLLGVELAKVAKAKNLEAVVFDRNGYLYHGRVAAVADGAREGGLQF